MGYVQQFHDEAGDTVDRSMWVDLTRRSDAELARTLIARLGVIGVSLALIGVGVVGSALLPSGSPWVLPSMIAVFAGILHVLLASGGLWRVVNERNLRRFARRVQSGPKPVVPLGVVRAHA